MLCRARAFGGSAAVTLGGWTPWWAPREEPDVTKWWTQGKNLEFTHAVVDPGEGGPRDQPRVDPRVRGKSH